MKILLFVSLIFLGACTTPHYYQDQTGYVCIPSEHKDENDCLLVPLHRDGVEYHQEKGWHHKPPFPKR